MGDYRQGSGNRSNDRDADDDMDLDLDAVLRFAYGGATPPPTNHPVAGFPPTNVPSASSFLPLQPPPQQQLQVMPNAVDWRLVLNVPPPPAVQPPAVQPPSLVFPDNTLPPSGGDGAGSSRSRRRGKKKVVPRTVKLLVPADGKAPDRWAWRKYGQKKIKDSPYHRSYYRCSSDKNCRARRQVERCSTHRDYLLITYIADHCHPMPLVLNSLAGTSRQKPPTVTVPPSSSVDIPATQQDAPQAPAKPASASSSYSLSATTPAPPFPATLRSVPTTQTPAFVCYSSLPLASPPLLSIPAVEQQPPDPALLASASASLPLTTQLLSPFLSIPGVDQPLQAPAPAPAPLASGSASLPLITQPLSPFLSIPAPAVEQPPQAPAQAPALLSSASLPLTTPPPFLSIPAPQVEHPPQAPVPAPAPLVSASASLSPITSLRSPSVQFDEEDDDAVALRMLLNDVDMTPQNALLFLPTPEELAQVYHAVDENMLFPVHQEPGSGGGGGRSSNNNVMFPAMPYEAAPAGSSGNNNVMFPATPYEAAPAAGSSSGNNNVMFPAMPYDAAPGSSYNNNVMFPAMPYEAAPGASSSNISVMFLAMPYEAAPSSSNGSILTAPAPAPIANLANETFSRNAWESATNAWWW